MSRLESRLLPSKPWGFDSCPQWGGLVCTIRLVLRNSDIDFRISVWRRSMPPEEDRHRPFADRLRILTRGTPVEARCESCSRTCREWCQGTQQRMVAQHHDRMRVTNYSSLVLLILSEPAWAPSRFEADLTFWWVYVDFDVGCQVICKWAVIIYGWCVDCARCQRKKVEVIVITTPVWCHLSLDIVPLQVVFWCSKNQSSQKWGLAP